jgi:hypothetical protein
MQVLAAQRPIDDGESKLCHHGRCFLIPSELKLASGLHLCGNARRRYQCRHSPMDTSNNDLDMFERSPGSLFQGATGTLPASVLP